MSTYQALCTTLWHVYKLITSPGQKYFRIVSHVVRWTSLGALTIACEKSDRDKVNK